MKLALRPFGAGALVVACYAASPRQNAAAQSDVSVKCYELLIGAWAPATRPLHTPPRLIRLDTTLAYPPSPNQELRTLEPDIPSLAELKRGTGRQGFQWWELVAPDTLQLTWSEGFEATFVIVEQRADSLVGEAIAWTDYRVRPRPRAPVTGWRVPCARLEAPSRRRVPAG